MIEEFQILQNISVKQDVLTNIGKNTLFNLDIMISGNFLASSICFGATLYSVYHIPWGSLILFTAIQDPLRVRNLKAGAGAISDRATYVDPTMDISRAGHERYCINTMFGTGFERKIELYTVAVYSWSIANNFGIDVYCRCLEIFCQIAQ